MSELNLCFSFSFISLKLLFSWLLFARKIYKTLESRQSAWEEKNLFHVIASITWNRCCADVSVIETDIVPAHLFSLPLYLNVSTTAKQNQHQMCIRYVANIVLHITPYLSNFHKWHSDSYHDENYAFSFISEKLLCIGTK